MNGRVGSIAARSLRIVPGGVSGVVESWLAEPRSGADEVRAALVRMLAGRIDDPETPPYVVVKLATELRALIGELDGAPHDSDADLARRLLSEVLA